MMKIVYELGDEAWLPLDYVSAPPDMPVEKVLEMMGALFGAGTLYALFPVAYKVAIDTTSEVEVTPTSNAPLFLSS